MSEDGAEISISEKSPKVKIVKTPVRTEVSTLKFDEFFGNSKVVDEKGNPKIVYHGSTQPFDKFDSKILGNPAGYMGASYYFTDSETDLNINYAKVGPDLARRIKLESDTLYEKIRANPDAYTQTVMDQFGIGKNEALEKVNAAVAQTEKPRWIYNNPLFKIATALTEKRLSPTGGVAYPVYLRIENPVRYQRKGGTLFKKPDVNRFKVSTSVAAEKHGLDARELRESVEATIKDEEIDVWEMGKKLSNVKLWRELKNPETGLDIFGQLMADIYKDMGYDGVIVNAKDVYGPRGDLFDRTFGRLLGNRGMKGIKGANHYIVWESDQIRTAIDKAGSPTVTSTPTSS